MVEYYEIALRAEFRLNQVKEEKTRVSKARGKKKGQNSEVIVKPSSSGNGQSTKKNVKFSNHERTYSKKTSYFLKAYL